MAHFYPSRMLIKSSRFSGMSCHVSPKSDGVFVGLVTLGAHVRPVRVVASNVDLKLIHLQDQRTDNKLECFVCQ